MTTITSTVDTELTEKRLAEKRSALEALSSTARDLCSQNEREAYWKAYTPLQSDISLIMNAVPELATLAPQIAAIETWINHLQTWREEWCTERDSLSARLDSRTREQEQRMISLTSAINNVDFGCQFGPLGVAIVNPLLREKITAVYQPTWDMQWLDPWRVGYGGLEEARPRLAKLTTKRDALRVRLDAALRQPEPVTT